MLNAAIESLVQKVQCGVVINFEKSGPDPPPVNDISRVDLSGDTNGNTKGSYRVVFFFFAFSFLFKKIFSLTLCMFPNFFLF